MFNLKKYFMGRSKRHHSESSKEEFVGLEENVQHFFEYIKRENPIWMKEVGYNLEVIVDHYLKQHNPDAIDFRDKLLQRFQESLDIIEGGYIPEGESLD